MSRAKYFISWFDVSLSGNVSGANSIVRTYATTTFAQTSLGSGAIFGVYSSCRKLDRAGLSLGVLGFSPYAFSFNASVLRCFSSVAARANAVWTQRSFGYIRSVLLRSRIPVLSTITQRMVAYQAV